MINLKGFERKWSLPNFRYYSGIGLEGPRNISKRPSQARILTRDLTRRPEVGDVNTKNFFKIKVMCYAMPL
jgi:hypothetical protein